MVVHIFVLLIIVMGRPRRLLSEVPLLLSLGLLKHELWREAFHGSLVGP